MSADLNEKIRAAFTNGHLVSLSIGGPSWKVPLEKEALKNQAANIQAGHRTVLQGDLVKMPELIEGRARGLLDKFCLPCPIGRGCRFVSDNNVGELLITLQELKLHYIEAARALAAGYESVKTDMRIKFPDQVAQMEAHWPEVSRWRPYYFHVTVTTMTIPKSLGGEDGQLLLDKYRDDEKRRTLLEAAIKEQARAEAIVLREMTENTITALREMFVGTIHAILEQKTKRSEKQGDKFHGKNIETLREMIIDIRRLDILGDSTLQNKLAEIQNSIDKNDLSMFTSNTSVARELETTLRSAMDSISGSTAATVESFTAAFGEGSKRTLI